MKTLNLVLLLSVFLISFCFAEDYPNEIPEDFIEGYNGEIPSEIDPAMYDDMMGNLNLQNLDLMNTELSDDMIPLLLEIGCPLIQSQESEIIGYELPKQIPLKEDIFNLYVSENPIAFIEINAEKKVSNFGCGIVHEKPTFNVYIKSLEIINEVNEETNFLEFYKEKKKSGDIKIDGVGFGKKIKLFFLNIGVGVAGWFM